MEQGILLKKCSLCGSELKYDEFADKENNELTTRTIKIRKMVNDGKVSVPFYGIPPDKRRLVDDKHIRFECKKCRPKE